MTFQEEIRQIQNAHRSGCVVNDENTLHKLKKRSDKYIDKICDSVRAEIKKKALGNTVTCEMKDGAEVDRRYETTLLIPYEFNLKSKSVKFEKNMVVSFGRGLNAANFGGGFILNDPALLRYIIEQICKRLEKDGVYLLSVTTFGSNVICRRSKDGIEEEMEKALRLYKKAVDAPSATARCSFSETLRFHFGYFI